MVHFCEILLKYFSKFIDGLVVLTWALFEQRKALEGSAYLWITHQMILYVCQGSSDIDQLGKIFAAFGTPKLSQWPDMVYLPDYVEYQYVPAPPLRSLFPLASDDALDLLSKMFTYDPKARISVQQALEHRWLQCNC